MTAPGTTSQGEFLMNQSVTERPWEAVFSDEERQIYEVYRRPGKPDLPWGSLALLVVDVTNAFLGPKLPTLAAAREVRTACGLPAWQTLAPIRTLLDAFHEAGRPVIYTRAYSESQLGGATVGAPESGAGNEIAEPIAPRADDVVIEKSRPNAFFGTPLASYLIREGIRGVIVTGGTTSGCVRATALDAAALGFTVGIAHDACFDRSMLSHNVALHELDVKYAAVLDAATIAKGLATSAGRERA